MSTVPPQESPRSPARSALRWWVRSLGSRRRCASSAAPMTSASTQPPPTEPIRRPPAPTSILVPAGTGVEPRTRATVASAPEPDRRTRSAAACQTFIPKTKLPGRHLSREPTAKLTGSLRIHVNRGGHSGVDRAVIRIVACRERRLVVRVPFHLVAGVRGKRPRPC